MKRNVSLYIAGQRVDLNDQSLILFNYTQEDLNNPTIVKNSYTQSISLPGTKNNNKIFGNIVSLDRVVAYGGGQSGSDFNPMAKTPFIIYNEMNEILESGYVKLNSVNRKGQEITYDVTLYGGLGSFLYSLAYDANGEKRSLADLDYLGTDNTISELDFTINAAAVLAAWNTAQSGDVDSIWKVLNFAPAYNGYPTGNFSANKALMIPSEQGLAYNIDGHTLKGGYSLLNMANNQDEWSVKDLRSYLQRPILSMNAFLEAIAKPMNNGGYDVDMSSISDLDFKKLWMTLPLIPSIGSIKQESGDLSLSFSSSQTTDKGVARVNVVGDVPAGSRITANINVKLQFAMPNSTYNTLSSYVYNASGAVPYTQNTAIFVQLLAYTSGGVLVGGSKVKALFPSPLIGTTDAQTMANALGYTPLWANEGYDNYLSNVTWNKKVASIYEYERELGFTCEASDVDHYILHVTSYNYTMFVRSGTLSMGSISGGTSSVARLSHDATTSYLANGASMATGTTANSISYTSSSELRSGATITKAMLLSTTNTPADYLLSFCKMFGLSMVYDSALRKITIVRRNDLYQDQIIDLSKRIDTMQENVIEPLTFSAKWYNFALEGVGGAFYNEYKNVRGRIYGSQRVNTGYDFNADSVDMMKDNVFKGAASVLNRSKYWNVIFNQQYFQPSPFQDKGNTYTLWNTDGESLETPISIPPSNATIGYYNTDNPGYDIPDAVKLELCDKDKKSLDGSNVLVYYNGKKNYPYFKVSDDLPIMSVVNDGQPCWIISAGSQNGVDVPIYSAYKVTSSEITDSLDFGVPAELDIPGATYSVDSTIYARCWANYLVDRFSLNTKVVRCKVDLSGFQVGQEMLRKFYWFGNSLWSLNAIRNYSLTTYDSAECEFIQVQDIDNYLNGQI